MKLLLKYFNYSKTLIMPFSSLHTSVTVRTGENPIKFAFPILKCNHCADTENDIMPNVSKPLLVTVLRASTSTVLWDTDDCSSMGVTHSYKTFTLGFKLQ